LAALEPSVGIRIVESIASSLAINVGQANPA